MAMWLLSALMFAAVGESDCAILQFTASWCEPCKQMQPSMEQLATDGWQVHRIDTDQRPDLAQQYQVQNLPTLVIVSGGQEVDRIVGVASYEQIHKRISRVSARSGYSAPSLAPVAQPSTASRATPQAPIIRGQSPGNHALTTLAASTVAAAQFATASSRNAPTPNTLTPNTLTPNTQTPNTQTLSIQDAIARAASATVRIRVDEGNTTAFGTGTIVDVHGEEALVLTCGHLFRDMTPGSQLSIDLFAGTPQEIKVAAQLIDFQAEETDIGLISFRLPVRIAPVPILPRGEQPQAGQQAFSFGCDHGQDPSRRDTKIRQINRYIGAANIEIAGAPAVGRSGGGLFDTQGRLIGVCNAADAEGDEGIYAAADVVYDQIERLQLSHLFEPQQAARQPSQAVAMDLERNSPSAPVALLSSSVSGFVQEPSSSSPNTSPDLASSFAMTSPPPATPGFHLSTREDESELICIVRGAHGQDRVITIQAPSAELLQRIQQDAQGELVP